MCAVISTSLARYAGLSHSPPVRGTASSTALPVILRAMPLSLPAVIKQTSTAGGMTPDAAHAPCDQSSTEMDDQPRPADAASSADERGCLSNQDFCVPTKNSWLERHPRSSALLAASA